jgi:hypothetical protein
MSVHPEWQNGGGLRLNKGYPSLFLGWMAQPLKLATPIAILPFRSYLPDASRRFRSCCAFRPADVPPSLTDFAERHAGLHHAVTSIPRADRHVRHKVNAAAGARLPVGQITSINQKRCQAPLAKYSSSVFRKYVFSPLVPPPSERGVSRSSRTWEAGCGGREAAQRACAWTKAASRTAKPCGPVPPTLGSSLARRLSRGDGG